MDSLTTASTPQDINVTILLLGGYQYQITLPSNSPLLLNLLNAVVHPTEKNQDEPPKLFQIPMNGQQQALWFSSNSLVGVITEPPIFIKAHTPVIPATPQAEIFKLKYWQIDNFLSPEDHQNLLNYALEQEQQFQLTGPATNTSDYPEHRDSLVLYYSPDFGDMVINRVKAMFWKALEKLDIPPFPITHIDAQLTAHNHGHYFRTHNDNGSARDETRMLSYVYYFYQEPKAFTGGELLIYDTQWQGQYAYSKLENFQAIEPLNNRIIFFYSGLMHEVLPVNCPSKQFKDSRFTVNGWVRK
jgi:Rps23 Pro-64 3,4-dihydroxylase Tpa1-like proline 4-hydroxylase